MNRTIICLLLVLGVFLAGCQSSKSPVRRQYTQPAAPVVICPDPGSNNLFTAVDEAIICVQNAPHKFKKVFADLLSIAKRNPNIDNGDIIWRFVEAVAIKGAYVSKVEGRSTWNRYFSPYLFSTTYYDQGFERVEAICPNRDQVIRDIMDELDDKKLGLLYCLGGNNPDVQGWYDDAAKVANGLIVSIKGTCLAIEN